MAWPSRLLSGAPACDCLPARQARRRGPQQGRRLKGRAATAAHLQLEAQVALSDNAACAAGLMLVLLLL